MFLLFSDGRTFDCVSFLTFAVSPIPSVAFTLLNSHVSQKVQMLSCLWLLALFYFGLHCKGQNETEYFAGAGTHTHTHTHWYYFLSTLSLLSILNLCLVVLSSA